MGQIRSRCRWFEAEISLFMMFFYDFHLIVYKLLLIFLNMQMKQFHIPPLDEKTCQIVSLMI